MPIITESLIVKMKEDVAAAIATSGTVEFGGDATLQAIFDLAIVALLAPEDSAALSDVRRVAKELDGYTDDQLGQYCTSVLVDADCAKSWLEKRNNLMHLAALNLQWVQRIDRDLRH